MEFKALKEIGLLELFSKLGKRVFMPQGVFHWVHRAKKEATIDALSINSLTALLPICAPSGYTMSSFVFQGGT